jgi:hypothetical protein
VVGETLAARGGEESTERRQPVDLIALCDQATDDLTKSLSAANGARGRSGHAALARELLCDDPLTS